MIGRVRVLAVLLSAIAVVSIATAASGQDAERRRPRPTAAATPQVTIPDWTAPSTANGAYDQEEGGSRAAAGVAPAARVVASSSENGEDGGQDGGEGSGDDQGTPGPTATPTATSSDLPGTDPAPSPTTTGPSGSPSPSGSTTGPTASPTVSPTATGDPSPTATTPTPADRRVLLGASGPNRPTVEALDTALGRQVRGLRVYRRWGEPLMDPTAQWAVESGRTLFLSVRSRYPDGRLIPYSAVAAATPGTPLNDDIRRFAEEVKLFPGTLYLTFNHEPDADPENGTAAEFAAAWRNWVGTLRAAGVTNARFVWTVTAYGFIRTDAQAAPGYWPGDDLVDVIGVDGYNAYFCFQDNGAWRSPAEVFGPAFAWSAQQHPGTPVALMEWSSVEDPAVPDRKARWIADLAALVADTPAVTAILQWGGGGVLRPGVPGCNYALDTSTQSLGAWHDLGLLPLLSAAFPPAP